MQHRDHGEKGGHGGAAADLNEISGLVIHSGLKVHKTLGPGLLESTCESCHGRELESRGLPHRRQVSVPLVYEGVRLEAAYRLDRVVADRVIVEIKATDLLNRLHEAQLPTYLRLTGLKVGLPMNPLLSVSSVLTPLPSLHGGNSDRAA